MKKLISLFSAIAMILTLMSTVAFADANNYAKFEEKIEGDILTLTFVLQTDKLISSAKAPLSLKDAFDAGATFVSGTAISDKILVSNLNKNNSGNATFTFTDTDQSSTGRIEMYEIKLNIANLTRDFTLPKAGAASMKAFEVKCGSTDLTDSFTNNVTGYVFTKPTTAITSTAGTKIGNTDDYLYLSTEKVSFDPAKGVDITLGNETKTKTFADKNWSDMIDPENEATLNVYIGVIGVKDSAFTFAPAK